MHRRSCDRLCIFHIIPRILLRKSILGAIFRGRNQSYIGCAKIRKEGCVCDSYDLSGKYSNQYDTDYYYSYRLPLFLEDEGDAAEINDEIEEKFAPIIIWLNVNDKGRC